MELKDVKVDGDKISFVELLNMGGNEIQITYTGTIAGGELKLTRSVGDFAKEDIVWTPSHGSGVFPPPPTPGPPPNWCPILTKLQKR